MARRLGQNETLTYALLGWWSAALMGPEDLESQFAVASSSTSSPRPAAIGNFGPTPCGFATSRR